MANSVRISSHLDDKVSSPLDRIRDKFDQMGKGAASASLIGNVGAQALAAGVHLAGAAIGKVVDIVGDSIAAFREDEKSQAGLRAALLANIPAWDGNVDAIEKVLASRMKLGFSDDTQRESLKILIATTHDHEKALLAQRVAMDLARFRSIDLATASDLIAKVMGGNVGILKRYGISLRDGATATEAMAAVTKLAGGAARAYAETDLGKVEAANIRLEESNERIGASFSKIELAVKPAMADASEHIADFVVRGIDGWSMLADLIGRKVDEITGKVPEIPAAVEAVDLGEVAEAAAEPIYTYFDKATTKAIAAVETGMQDVAKEIRQGRSAIVNAMKETIAGTYDPLVAAAEIVVTRLELSEAEKLAATKKYSELTQAEVRKMTADQIKAAKEWTDSDRAEANLRLIQTKRTLAEQLAEQTQYGSDAAVLAAQSGAYTTEQWRTGLTSQDPLVAASWAHLLEIQTRAQLDAASAAWMGGSTAGSAFGTGVTSGINSQAGNISGAVATAGAPMTGFHPNGFPIGATWATKIAEGITANDWKIGAAIKVIGSRMIGFSPPKEGPLKDIDTGGANIAQAWVDAFAGTLRGANLDGPLSRFAGIAASAPTAAQGGLATATNAGPQEFHIYIDGREIEATVSRQSHYRRGAVGRFPA